MWESGSARLADSMPYSCCVPQCHKKGYRSVTIDEKVTFHTFQLDSSGNRTKRRQWIHVIRRYVGKYFKPGKWTKTCSLLFRPTDFYIYCSSYQTVREDSLPSIFLFDTEKNKAGTKATCWLRYQSSPVKDHTSGSGSLENDNTGASDGVVAVISHSARKVLKLQKLCLLVWWNKLRYWSND